MKRVTGQWLVAVGDGREIIVRGDNYHEAIKAASTASGIPYSEINSKGRAEKLYDLELITAREGG